MIAGPGDNTTAAGRRGHGRLRVSRGDREQVIESLKTAFVEDRLTKEELDASEPGTRVADLPGPGPRHRRHYRRAERRAAAPAHPGPEWPADEKFRPGWLAGARMLISRDEQRSRAQPEAMRRLSSCPAIPYLPWRRRSEGPPLGGCPGPGQVS